jgi:general secretion pathway protein G
MNTIDSSTSSTKSDKGFTLVELLIVIVILGILATVTVFAVRGITDQGKKSTCDSDKKTLEVAVEAYYAKYNVDPANEAALIPGFVKSDSPNYNIAAGVISPASGNANGCS